MSLRSAGFDIEIMPSGIAPDYLSCLNRCFPGWGGPDLYRWAFERRVGGPQADLMVLRLRGQLVAGSAVSYRRASLATGGTVYVGIMTGSWTLPEARGQGAFTRVIEESLKLASGRGAALLLAFVTEDNPSARRLTSAGSARFPTYYLSSTAQTSMPRSSVDTREIADVAEVAEKLITIGADAQVGSSHFVYPDPRVWASQFLHRPETIELLAFDESAWCVLNRAPTSDRVLLLVADPEGSVNVSDCITALLRRALDRDRQLLLYSTRMSVSAECERLGLSLKPGFLTALVGDETRLREALDLRGPRPSEGWQALAARESPWFLGDWDLQSGDRA